VDLMLRQNEFLAKENDLFTSFLRKNDPHQLEVLDDGESQRKGRRGPGKRKDLKTVTLSSEQKFEIASKEVDDVKDEIEKFKKHAEKMLDNLKAYLEVTDIRIAEIRKEAYEFKRDIVVGAENPRTGKTMSERVVRYFEDKSKGKEALVEKLRLKNSSLKSQIRKLDSQLQQKEEMGEVLHPIDFQQLQIENQQYLEKIEERNHELLKLKLTAGNTVQILNTFKKRLSTLTQESEWLRKEIRTRREFLDRTKGDVSQVIVEHEQAALTNKRMKEDQESYRVPAVLSYVELKAEQEQLNKKIGTYRRKVEIADMAVRKQRTILKTLKAEVDGPQN
jgi:hypothetical protein